MHGNNSVSCSTILSFHDVVPRISCSYRYELYELTEEEIRIVEDERF